MYFFDYVSNKTTDTVASGSWALTRPPHGEWKYTSCISKDLPMGPSPVQGILPNIYKQDSEAREKQVLR
jgi:hypothetical protein